MASTITHLPPPPRTPSPKIRIHKSQSFDSPSSKLSVTPIDDSPYSKSASSIPSSITILPKPSDLAALRAAERAMIISHIGTRVVLHKCLSDESMLSDSDISSAEYSPTSDAGFRLFSSSSPSLPSAPAPPLSHSRHPSLSTSNPPPPYPTSHSSPSKQQFVLPSPDMYLDASSPMYDPWLVRVVLDLYDVRGFDWTMIAEPIERIWGFRTSSAEVLGILAGNGRVGGVRWWD